MQTTNRCLDLAVRVLDEEGRSCAHRIIGLGIVRIARDGVGNPTIPTAFLYWVIANSSQWRSFLGQPLPAGAVSPPPTDPGILRRSSCPIKLLGITFGLAEGSIAHTGRCSWIRPFGFLRAGLMLCFATTEYPITTTAGMLFANKTTSLIDMAADSSSFSMWDLESWIFDLPCSATACVGFGLLWYAYRAVAADLIRLSRDCRGGAKQPGIISPELTRNPIRSKPPSEEATSVRSDLDGEVGG